MARIKFSETIIIHRDAAVVFDCTQDYSTRLHWDRFLQKAELVEGAGKAGNGAKAYCVAKNGIAMTTEYVSFNRPKTAAVAMIGRHFMFQSFLGSWTFKPVDTSQTEVIFLYAFSLKFPFSILATWVRRRLQSNVRQRLIDLKTYMEKQTADSLPNTGNL